MDRRLIPTFPIPSLDAAESEVRAGLPGDSERLRELAEVEDFYRLRNRQYIRRRESEDEDDYQDRPKRTSKLLRCVARKLAEPLYNPGPTRHWQGDAAINTFLQEALYAGADASVRMGQADTAATIHHCAAIQMDATGDPGRPLRATLWKGHELAVFCPEDNPCEPYAVATIETISGGSGKVRTRYRLWSAAERRTLLSAPYYAGKRVQLHHAEEVVSAESGPNPYPGVLPFAFVRNEPPENDWWTGGIGPSLKDLNEEIDRALSDLAQHVRDFLNPLPWARGLSVASRFLEKVGKFVHLRPDAAARAGDYRIQPEVGYLQASLAVEQAWFDLKSYADASLEELEVPLVVVRSDASTDLSGIAIEKKTVPLIGRTRRRQPLFTTYERHLAETALAVAGSWYRRPELTAAARTPANLICIWPEPRILETSSVDGLHALQTELDMGLADPFEVLARLRGITLEQAGALAGEIAERRRKWSEIMGAGDETTDSAESPEPNDSATPSEDDTEGVGDDTEAMEA